MPFHPEQNGLYWPEAVFRLTDRSFLLRFPRTWQELEGRSFLFLYRLAFEVGKQKEWYPTKQNNTLEKQNVAIYLHVTQNLVQRMYDETHKKAILIYVVYFYEVFTDIYKKKKFLTLCLQGATPWWPLLNNDVEKRVVISKSSKYSANECETLISMNQDINETRVGERRSSMSQTIFFSVWKVAVKNNISLM